jgi:hypothetical protein
LLVTHVRQTLQHAVTIGTFSAVELMTGSARAFVRSNILRV